MAFPVNLVFFLYWLEEEQGYKKVKH